MRRKGSREVASYHAIGIDGAAYRSSLCGGAELADCCALLSLTQKIVVRGGLGLEASGASAAASGFVLVLGWRRLYVPRVDSAAQVWIFGLAGRERQDGVFR